MPITLLAVGSLRYTDIYIRLLSNLSVWLGVTLRDVVLEFIQSVIANYFYLGQFGVMCSRLEGDRFQSVLHVTAIGGSGE